MKRLLTTTAIIAGALWFGPAAYAAPISITTASDFVVDWSLTYNSSNVVAQAHAEFANFVFSPDQHSVTFDMRVTNTSTGTGANQNPNVRLTSFGWDTAPAASGETDNTNVFFSQVPDQLGNDQMSICFYSGPNCNGGAQGGLEDPKNTGFQGDPTTTGKFSVKVDFGQSLVPPLTFDNFDAKFQAAEPYGSIHGFGTVTDCPGCIINPTSDPVPEPASLALLGVGLLGTAVFARRRTH